MATTTTNFGWDIPQSTDLVKDGATAIAALGQDIDTAFIDLKGGTTGQVLSKASGSDLDFSWIEQDDTTLAFNAQTGTTYTLVIADLGKLVTLSNASGITLTVPPSTFTAGQQINLTRYGTGSLTVQGGSGVTVNATPGLILRAQYSAATLFCINATTFVLFGDLSA